jgi:hypothetical protein
MNRIIKEYEYSEVLSEGSNNKRNQMFKDKMGRGSIFKNKKSIRGSIFS